jgi:hypothetical protein
MSIGTLARQILGRRLFKIAGEAYRGVFVDLGAVAKSIVHAIPRDAHILDVGGGDGAPLNHLLKLREDVRVTMIDLQDSIGSALHPALESRVRILPMTSIRDFAGRGEALPDVVLLSDVLHHVPAGTREDFMRDLTGLAGEATRVIIKDVEPVGWRAFLGLWCDKNVTGDRGVSLVSRSEARRLLQHAFGNVEIQETDLFERDRPNYSLVCRRA